QASEMEPVQVRGAVDELAEGSRGQLDGAAALPHRRRRERRPRHGWRGRRWDLRLVPVTMVHGHRPRRFRNSFSSMISTPSCTALSYLVPGFSPATTKSVFFETLDVTLAPAASSAAMPSSR